MKKIVTILIFLYSIGQTNFAQQSLQFEWSYTNGTEKPGATYALSWYSTDALLDGSLMRVSYSNTKKDFYEANPTHRLQLDVVKRWNSSLDKKINLFFEAGMSGMIANTKLGGYYSSPYYCDCIVNTYIYYPDNYYLYLEDSDTGITYGNEEDVFLMEFLPGVNARFGLDILTVKNIYLGIHTGGHLYYHLGLKESVSYLQNGLQAGFRF